MNTDCNNLAVRALNYWRPVYTPTYLGLRLFLQQVPQSKSSDYLQQFLPRKLTARNSSRYRRFVRFKGIDNRSQKAEYRDFFAASPSSALGEAYALRELSSIPTLANRKCVFSYGWPGKKEGQSYSYFFSGYEARMKQVSSLLRMNPRYHVLVEDVRSFYPSIKRDIVFKRLTQHLDKSEVRHSREFLDATCHNVANIAETGIPIGPALSHVFGNIAMESVDARMYRLLGDRYLRYVDDILLVLDPDEIGKVRAEFETLIEAEGLALHGPEGKRDEITAQDWLGNMRTNIERSLGKQFDNLVQRIKLFLWLKPDRLSSLQREFRDEGISLPLMRFAVDARYGRFQRFMDRLIRTTPGGTLSLFSNLRQDDERRLASIASRLRSEFLKAANQIDVRSERGQGMVRRFRVMRLRYLLNRLLYLCPIDNYGNLLELAPAVDEFLEYRGLIMAVMKTSLDPILSLPGPTVTAFASLWQEFGSDHKVPYDERLLSTTGALDSICMLGPYGVAQVPNPWIESLPDADSELVRFSLLQSRNSRISGDLTYEDEVRTLQLGASVANLQGIMRSRFDDLESVSPDALLLSDYGY
jgi:hypothetical protein